MILNYKITKRRYKEIAFDALKKENIKNKIKTKLSYIIPLIFLIVPIYTLFMGNKEVIMYALKITLKYMIGSFIVVKIFEHYYYKALINNTVRDIETMIDIKLSKSNDLMSFAVEIDETGIRKHNEVVDVEISYKSINGVIIEDDYIKVKFASEKSIYIPLEAFENKNEFNEAYKIIVEYTGLYEENILNEVDVKSEEKELIYESKENDLKNYYLYFMDTKIGDMLLKSFRRIYNIHMIVLVIVVSLLLDLLNKKFDLIESLCIFGVALIIGNIFLLKKIYKKNIIKVSLKKFKAEHKKIIFNKDYLVIGNEEQREKFMYENVSNIEEINDLIVASSGDAIIFTFPARVFNNNVIKEFFLNAVKSKMKIEEQSNEVEIKKKVIKSNTSTIAVIIIIIVTVVSIIGFSYYMIENYEFYKGINEETLMQDLTIEIGSEISDFNIKIDEAIEAKNEIDFPSQPMYEEYYSISKAEKINDDTVKAHVDINLTYHDAVEVCEGIMTLKYVDKKWKVEEVNSLERLSIAPMQLAGDAFLDMLKENIYEDKPFVYDGVSNKFHINYINKLGVLKETGTPDMKTSYLSDFEGLVEYNMKVTMSFDFEKLEWNLISFESIGR